MYLKPIVHSLHLLVRFGRKDTEKIRCKQIFFAIQILLSCNMQKIYTICNHYTSYYQLCRKYVERIGFYKVYIPLFLCGIYTFYASVIHQLYTNVLYEKV